MKIEIDPNKELFKWGPIDGKIIYPDFFTVAFSDYAKHYYPWPNLLGLFFNGKMAYVLANKDLRESGRVNFSKYILNDENFKKSYRKWNNHLKAFLYFQKSINKDNLKNLRDKELSNVYLKWAKMYREFWALGGLPEISNWGGEVLLEEKLREAVPENNFISIFERLSAPQKLSFYQQAELDLLELRKFVNNKVFEKKLENYQQKYFFILNSYHHTKILSKKYFRKELLSYSKPKALVKIKELKNFSIETKKEKEIIIKKYRLSKRIAKIANRLSFCIWWQDIRKYYIFMANHKIDIFLNEFTRRYNIKHSNLQYYNYFEIIDLLKTNKKITQSDIEKRIKNTVIYYSKDKNKLTYIYGKKAKPIIKDFMKVKADKSIKEFKGMVVSRGKIVKSKVKIITSPQNIKKMNQGDILVAPMTSPEYIIAMRKASAIITDEGGITSHAAIVSRELKKPCIVNTKIATKVLKDGQKISIDTNKGVIKIIR